MDERKKTTVMIPHGLNLQITDWGNRLGVGKNGFVSIASAMFLLQLTKLESVGKRQTMIAELEKIVQRLMEDARDAA